ncbi:hypothetical protein BM1_05806 [Bipolaris maydis]|nr:hypothetical protein BM1_05806 [Bipolaris maydis]
MKSTKTPQSTPPSGATPAAKAPPRAAAPIYTMSRADTRRKQQLCKKLDDICVEVISRSTAFSEAPAKLYHMCLQRKYMPYVDHDSEVNLALLTITCEHKRQQLDEVVKTQLEVARRARLLREAEAEEKRLDAAFWKLVNKYKKG